MALFYCGLLSCLHLSKQVHDSHWNSFHLVLFCISALFCVKSIVFVSSFCVSFSQFPIVWKMCWERMSGACVCVCVEGE